MNSLERRRASDDKRWDYYWIDDDLVTYRAWLVWMFGIVEVTS